MPDPRKLVHAGMKLGMRQGLTREQAAVVVHTAATVARGIATAQSQIDSTWLDQVIGHAEVWLPPNLARESRVHVSRNHRDPGGGAAVPGCAHCADQGTGGAQADQPRPGQIGAAAEALAAAAAAAGHPDAG